MARSKAIAVYTLSHHRTWYCARILFVSDARIAGVAYMHLLCGAHMIAPIYSADTVRPIGNEDADARIWGTAHQEAALGLEHRV